MQNLYFFHGMLHPRVLLAVLNNQSININLLKSEIKESEDKELQEIISQSHAAILHKYKQTFGQYASLNKTNNENDIVEGYVINLNSQQVKIIDCFEDYPNMYQKVMEKVEVKDQYSREIREEIVTFYVFNEEKRIIYQKPQENYLKHVCALRYFHKVIKDRSINYDNSIQLQVRNCKDLSLQFTYTYKVQIYQLSQKILQNNK